MQTYPNYKPVVIVSDALMPTSAIAIRASLEAFGLRTSLFLCGLATNVWDVLEGKLPDCDYLILDSHGSDGKMIFEVASLESAGFHQLSICPDDVRSKAHLPNTFVISLGCTTGSSELADAFLASGCRGFIGPTGSPHVHVSLLVVLHFYRHLLQHVGFNVSNPHLSEKQAFEAACQFDSDAAMFTMYQR